MIFESKMTIVFLESLIDDPSVGLPEDIFLFISRNTPLVNVDLLIKNENNDTLLTWREDCYNKQGWHIPGGIVRYKEAVAKRIKAVAVNELGAEVKFKENPLAINEILLPIINRAHAISLLYECTLLTPLDVNRKYIKEVPKPGEWAWHSKCPDNLIIVQDIYKKFI